VTKLIPAFAVIAALCGPWVAAVPAHAQLSRTFVSAASGNDANNCDRPTPCRSFQGAHDKTNDQGEITVLDPGGYGAVTITKSISIVNDGVGEASILVSGGVSGISIKGGPAAYVNLRGLTVQGIGFGGGMGLQFNSGFALTITNCVFRNHTGNGIFFSPQVAGTSNLSISNTLVSDNQGHGIDVFPVANVTARVALDGVASVNNKMVGIIVSGSFAPGTIDATVANSVSANNGQSGVTSASDTGKATTTLTLIRSVVANNGAAGLTATNVPTAILRVGQSAVTGNAATRLVVGNAVIQSFGDNYVVGNADGDPALPTLVRK
jgi:hypothetical protein